MARIIARGAAALAALVLVVGGLVPAVPAAADEVRDLQWHLDFLDIGEAHRYSQGEGI